MCWNRTAAVCLALAGLALSGCNDDSTVVVPDTAPPLAPKSVRAYTKQDGTVMVKWEPNLEPDLAGYNVYSVAPQSKLNNTLIPGSKNSCSATFEGKGWYRVTAVDYSGNESPPSKIARATQSFQTPPEEPVTPMNDSLTQ